MKFKIYDRVRLITDEYSDHINNPQYGGKYGKVVGTIIEDDNSGRLNYKVQWDTGSSNSYCEDHLALDNITKPIHILDNDLFTI